MRLSFARGLVLTGLVAGVSSAPALLLAQPGGVSAGCEIDPNNPKDLAVLELQYQRAKGATTPDARQSALKTIIKELDTKPERFAKNPAGVALRMNQALTLWAVEPGIGYNPQRALLGFVTDPGSTIDLIGALDASFKAMVAAIPSCDATVRQMRQNEVWLALTRRALDASNAGQLDTATFYANKSLQMSTENPYPHYVLANVANVKKERAAAIGHWQQVIKEAGADTNYRDIKNSSMYLVSVNQLEAAEAAQGAEQVKWAKDAVTSFKALLGTNPDTPDAPNIMQSLADAMRMAGDSASIPTIYADMLVKPAGYSDVSLTMAGVIATRMNKTDDALKLFDAAVKKNPAARDALRNLAAAYYGKEQFTNMFAPLKQLVAIDPNNYDGWMMFAYASQGLAKAVKMPEVKKGAVPTPDQRKVMEAASTERKAWNDSTTKYMTIADALPVKVDVTMFQKNTKDVALTLQFEQTTATDGTYNVTVEFVDAAGAVIGTATQSVGPLKKGAPKSAVFKAAATNVAGYRYKALK